MDGRRHNGSFEDSGAARLRYVRTGRPADVAEPYVPLNITVSYAGQDGNPKPFLLILNWLKVGGDWKVASEIILRIPPAPTGED